MLCLVGAVPKLSQPSLCCLIQQTEKQSQRHPGPEAYGTTAPVVPKKGASSPSSSKIAVLGVPSAHAAAIIYSWQPCSSVFGLLGIIDNRELVFLGTISNR